MAQFEQWFSQDFTDDIIIRHRENVMFSGDDKGAIVGVRLFAGGTAYSGGGTVTGFVKRSDGGVVVVNGTLSGNSASIVIPSAALAYSGPIGVQIVLNGSGSTTTVLKVIYSVDDTTGTPVDPGSVMPSLPELIAAANAAISAMEAKGQEVLDSIPSDYTALSAEVENLTNSFYDKYDANAFYLPGYLQPSGATHSDTSGNFWMTPAILLEGTGKIHAKLYQNPSIVAPIVFFSDINVVLSAVTIIDNTAQSAGIVEGDVAIPAGAKYVRFGLRDKTQTQYAYIIYDSVVNMISDSAKSAAQRIVKISHFPNAGYLKNNGSVQTDTTGNWYLSDYIQLPIGAEQITFQLYQYSTAVAMIAFYDNNGIRLSYIATGGTDGALYKATVNIPAGAYAVRATYHTGSGEQYVELIYPYQDAVQYANAEKAFMRLDTLDKPFTLAGADVGVFGDSIAKGYDHTSTVVANPWPNVLGSKLGFHSIANYAVGGQGYSRGSNNVLAQLQSASLSSKTIIFIGAGTNDYHYGIRLSVFDAAVESAFAYVDANKPAAAKVIVITPINRTAAPDANSTQFASLDDYRKIITQRALLHGYSVIDGSKFGFSDIAGAYQESTMQDGLHPNQTGYNFYAAHIAGLIG